MTKNPRYAGKPLLRLMELYVLLAIGHLSALDAQRLAAMAPNLRRTYQTDGTWDEVIATTLEFPPNMPDLIRGMWEKNQAIAKQRREVLTPELFAEMFVDVNLSLDPPDA